MDRKQVLKLGDANNKVLLDVGAGPLAVIAAREFNCDVTTIDISASALESAHREAMQAGLEERITFSQQDATDLTWAENSFDIAISYGTLHHVPVRRRQRFLQELFRVARERIIIAEYTSSEFQCVHPGGEYESVDLEWLEDYLRILGKTERHLGDQMNVYICHIQKVTR